MMVETILESSQDFGMSNGSLPQWKRELLQRRLARSRPCAAPAPPPPPPPPPPPADEDEELRYGPGIVKRLKSRYLSLALRDAPRRRPSVLRRAASLEHLLDERPPPVPRARAPRPASLAAAPALAPRQPAGRRDSVKRARSVDALSRLDLRDDAPAPPSPEPPPLAPRPPSSRTARPPRRPQPLLREAERPPPDVVRSTLRKFESAPARRPAPAARVSAVLRGLEPRRSVSPESSDSAPVPRSPSPRVPIESPPPPVTPPPLLPTETPPPIPTTPTPLADFRPATPPPTVSSSTRPASPPNSEPELLSPIGSPAPPITTVPRFEPKTDLSPKPDIAPKVSPAPKIVQISKTARIAPEATPVTEALDESEGCAAEAEARRVSRAALEEIARAGSSVRYAFSSAGSASHLPPLSAINPVLAARGLRRVGVIRPMPAARPAPEPETPPPDAKAEARLAAPPSVCAEAIPRAPESPERVALVNGHSTPEPSSLSRIGAAGIERAWSGSAVKRIEAGAARPSPLRETPDAKPSWLRSAGTRPRAPPPHATSVVFNFSNRKEVPDYIENDGIILRASRRNRIKAGEPGVVVLRPEALTVDTDSEADELDADGGGPPSPCDVRFVNDNILINGKSSMPGKPNKDRIAKLKLQFDDTLTRTFEYPSETSMSEDFPPSSPTAPAPAPSPLASAPAPPAPAAQDSASLADNTHIASAALSRYTPSKTCAAAFQLGLTNPHSHTHAGAVNGACSEGEVEGQAVEGVAGEGEVEGDARPCGADAAKSWSDARQQHTDLLF